MLRGTRLECGFTRASREIPHTGGGDTTPGHVANDYNPPVPPQADPAPRPDGEDVTPDPDP